MPAFSLMTLPMSSGRAISQKTGSSSTCRTTKTPKPNQRHSLASGLSDATPRRIVFDLPEALTGTAHLRIAICGTGTRTLAVEVNGTSTDGLTELSCDGVITRHGSQGIWYEADVTFDASLLLAGKNTLTLTVPEGPVNNGLIYDYLRLEVSD